MNKEAYSYAIKILSKRDYSVHKMSTKLKERKFTSDDIDLVIDKLIEKNYLREEEYARQRVRGLFNKGYSSRYIIQKLKAENVYIEQSFIDELKKEWQLDENEIVQNLIHKKTRSLAKNAGETYKQIQKIRRFLESKGFRSENFTDDIKEALSYNN